MRLNNPLDCALPQPGTPEAIELGCTCRVIGHDVKLEEAAPPACCRPPMRIAPSTAPPPSSMSMNSKWRHPHFHLGLIVLIALAAFFLIRMRAAGGATVAETNISEGHRLAQAWCEGCHVIGPQLLDIVGEPPSFQAVANQPGMTPLALKVFLRTSHRNMPNIVVSPAQAEALASYILSLKAR